MGSQRLPGKSMMKLAGEPLVGRILERIARCNSIDHTILAIPNNKENESLLNLAKNYDVEVFQGSENNLIERFYYAVLPFNTDIIRLILPCNSVNATTSFPSND